MCTGLFDKINQCAGSIHLWVELGYHFTCSFINTSQVLGCWRHNADPKIGPVFLESGVEYK